MNRIILLDVKPYQGEYSGFDFSAVALVEMTPELAKKILARVKLAKKLREEDDRFLRLIFYDDALSVYDAGDIVELALDEIVIRDDNPFDEDDEERLDFCQMLVDYDGGVEWRFSAKHSETTACSPELHAEELEKFLEDA